MTQPIIPGFNPDPSITRVGEDYYLTVSSFEYFPGHPIYHSRDLVNWELIGHGLTRRSQLNLDNAWTSGGLYAPTLRYHDGTFWLISTNTSGPEGQKNFLLKTRDIRGEWSDPIWVPEARGIDPSLFIDDDGQAYYTWSARFPGGRCEIHQALIDLETGKFREPAQAVWQGMGAKGVEAPHLYRHGEFYYMMVAEGGTEYGHLVSLARSRSPWGPWEECPHNPILTHRSVEHPVQAVGHADLVWDAHGACWLVALGIRPKGYHAFHVLGRETFLAPVNWTDDGWPVIGDNGRLPEDLPASRNPDREEHCRFDGRPLDLGWYHLRNPREENYEISSDPGGLILHGDEQNLDNMFWPTWIGRKQRAHACRVRTALHFAPREDGDEAGLCIWQNYDHHYEIAIVPGGSGTRRDVIVRRRIGSLQKETARQALPDDLDKITLGINATDLHYALGWAANPDDDLHILDTGEARYLSTEVGGRFTGVFFALYATGNGLKASAPARFTEFHVVAA